MSKKQSNLTDKEMEDLQSIVTDTLASICAMADKHNIDRDSMLKYFSDMLSFLAEIASIQNYETNHTCNCQHNSNPRDNDPYCRCDGKLTDADMIRNMSDEELTEWLKLSKLYKQSMEDMPDEIGVLPKDVYTAGYNKAIEDYHRLIAEEIKNDPTNPYLLHFYNVNNYIKECLTKR
uniref:23S rRNA pseudouridine synthase D n=1 Tax=virus sp. ctQmo6 TaxID=2827990 RepID=A0A8S5RGP4_9VIRU|nr:MAG TPA: 23S rRNA pseudouridine synthase D [virus sp. ctQmo6]